MIKIRKIIIDDAESYLELINKTTEETEFTMREPDENKYTNLENTLKDIKFSQKFANNIILVAEDNGRLVGYLGAYGGRFRRTQHKVDIAIAIRLDYRAKGIGYQLFSELENWAHKNSIRKLNIVSICSNDHAQALYKKVGFEIEGVLKDFIFINGKYENAYCMGKIFS